MDTEKLILARFERIKGEIPLDNLARNCVKNGQTLFGEILDWLRDYYNEPKANLWGLAVYTLGHYALTNGLQNEIVDKKL